MVKIKRDYLVFIVEYTGLVHSITLKNQRVFTGTGGSPKDSARNPPLRKMYYTYILTSKKNGRHYYGSTQNLSERLKKHNSGKVKSTKGYRP